MASRRLYINYVVLLIPVTLHTFNLLTYEEILCANYKCDSNLISDFPCNMTKFLINHRLLPEQRINLVIL